MSEKRCDKCGALLQAKDLKKEKCWKCDEPVKQEVEVETQVEETTQEPKKSAAEKLGYALGKKIASKSRVQQATDFSMDNKEVSAEGVVQLNKVVNVTLVGCIIGLIGVRPNNALNSRIKKENVNGWKVIQIIPSSSGNLLLSILRVILLIVTLFLYTSADGYYVVMERIENK